MFYLLLVVLGAVGVVIRYMITQSMPSTLPIGTFVVNLLGCFLMGYISTKYSVNLDSSLSAKAIGVGLLGGLTTYSSFAMDTVRLFEQGKPLFATGNIVAHVFLLIPICYMGARLARI